MGQRNHWAGTGWSRVPPERALVGNRFCPCPEWNGSGGRGCERPLNGKKEPGAPSCSTPALRRPFPRFIFKPHHHLLSSGYDARLPDAQTEAQSSATAYLESRGPHSGGAAIWARNRGCVHGAWPNAGSEKCRQAEEGELAQGPPGGTPTPCGSPRPPTGLRRPAGLTFRTPGPGRSAARGQVAAGIANRSRTPRPGSGRGLRAAGAQSGLSRETGRPALPGYFFDVLSFQVPGPRGPTQQPPAAGAPSARNAQSA